MRTVAVIALMLAANVARAGCDQQENLWEWHCEPDAGPITDDNYPLPGQGPAVTWRVEPPSLGVIYAPTFYCSGHADLAVGQVIFEIPEYGYREEHAVYCLPPLPVQPSVWTVVRNCFAWGNWYCAADLFYWEYVILQ